MNYKHFSLTDYMGLFDNHHRFSIDYHQLANSLEEEIAREFCLSDRMADNKFGQIKSTSAGDFEYCSRLVDFAKKWYPKMTPLRENSLFP